MVKLIPINKKKSKRFLLVILMLAIIADAVFFIFKREQAKDGITVAEAAKMIAYGNTQNVELLSKDQEGYWYEPYIKFVNDNGYIDNKKAGSNLRYSDVMCLIKKLGADEKEYSDVKGKSGYIKKTDFIDVYFRLADLMENGDKISRVDAVIAGTPSNLTKAGEWQAYTTKGNFRFTGLKLDDKIDHKVRIVVCDNELLAIESVLTDDVTYQNVWIKSSESNSVDFNIYGADRTFSVSGLSENVSNVLADVNLKAGKITGINIKTDTISGKVLSVTDQYVEIDGYGKVSLDEYFMIYDIYNEFAVKSYKDIIVGYALQDFIVADGKICGAVISKPLNVENIRVILKTSGFKDIFHQNVSMTSDQGCTVTYGETSVHYDAGQNIDVDSSSPMLAEGRFSVTPDADGSITVLSIDRSQGKPSYEGKIEVSTSDGGLILINDIDIEKYLKRVVPSEMPASFGVEALKVQSVCARSYAYHQLTNNYYSMYGAHADDSTQFQVYNNTVEHEESNEAIKQTQAQVLTYNGEVVQTYYYSTSCGATTNVGLWGTDTSEYPYFLSKLVSREDRNLNLCDESTFEQFITSKNENDYDSTFPLYRWSMDVGVDEMSNTFNSRLYEKYLSAPSKVLTLNDNNEFVQTKVTTVGTIHSISVNQRASGGAITSLTVSGSQATVQINSESIIRGIFGNSNIEMTTNTGTTKMASLPSTFCIFRELRDGNGLAGFRITGGGYGHGIGMSQNAAGVMANENMSYTQILQFFYPGTEVKTKTAG